MTTISDPRKTTKKPKVADPRIQTLRNIFRSYHLFLATFEDANVSEITAPDGVVWSLWDIKELYRVAVTTKLLPLRQRQAIELFLVMNLPEDRVAEIMEIKVSNPVGMYATTAIVHLLREIDAGNIINPWRDNSMENDD